MAVLTVKIGLLISLIIVNLLSFDFSFQSLVVFVAGRQHSKKVNQTNKSQDLLAKLESSMAIVNIFLLASNTGEYNLH